MSIISKRSIEEVRSRADIVALIGDYTNLTRSGTRWKGLSPFAVEKTPSFFVDAERGTYYCFSTSQGGDIFKFLMVREGLTFRESVEKIAQRFGITLEYENSSGFAERSLRGVLFEIHEYSKNFFRERFLENSEIAAKVREYWLRERGFSLEVAEEFSIGFLPENRSRELVDLLISKHFPERAIENSGMFGNVSKAKNLRSRRVQFESRLIIPIRDIQGRVIAFSARKIPGITPETPFEEAKYKNSSESEIFKKGQTLFNIDKAKSVFTDFSLKKSDQNSREIPFVLVEGQLDAIRCFSAGMKTAVAGQGTGITLFQMQLLARYSRRLDCLLDADAAGTKAALRLAPLAFEAGLDLNFLSIPNGKDPDEFLRERDSQNAAGTRIEATAGTTSEKVSEILRSKKTAIDFISEHFFSARERLSSAQKQDALTKIYEILSAANSLVFRSEALMILARKAGIERLTLERDFAQFLKRKENKKNSREDVSIRFTNEISSEASTLTTLEADILILALQNESVLPKIAENVPLEWIDSENLGGKILNRIIAEFLEGTWENSPEFLQNLLENDEERNFFAKISIQQNSTENADELAEDCIRRLCEKFCARERKKIDEALSELSSDSPELTKWLQRDKELRNLLKIYKK